MFGGAKKLNAIFPGQSLLLSTNVLNDTVYDAGTHFIEQQSIYKAESL